MSGWGSPWGSPWGAEEVGTTWACEIAESRMLHWHPEGNARKWVCAYAENVGAELDTLLEILGGFDLDYAVGAQLDTLGSIVGGLPRSGVGDDRYRVLLRIQVLLLLSFDRDGAEWTGTVANVLAICRQFVGDTANAITLINLPPKSFLLSIPDIADDIDLFVLFAFLSKAIYAEVLGYVVLPTSDDSLWNSDSVVVTDGGIHGSASVVVDPSSTWARTLVLGEP